MTHEEVQDWLDRYVEAWRANEPQRIADLFTEDAVYSYRPWLDDEYAFRGRDAVVGSWLDDPDDPGSWDAHYGPYVVDGERAVAVGWSRYAAHGNEPQRTFHNAYLLRFAPDGRCAEFREFYMEEGR